MSLTFASKCTSIAVAGFVIVTSLVTYLAMLELFLDLISDMKSTPSV